MNWRFEKIDEVTSEDLQRLLDRSLKFPKDRILAGEMNREVISDVPPESFSVLGKIYEGGTVLKIPRILLLHTEPAKELIELVGNHFGALCPLEQSAVGPTQRNGENNEMTPGRDDLLLRSKKKTVFFARDEEKTMSLLFWGFKEEIRGGVFDDLVALSPRHPVNSA